MSKSKGPEIRTRPVAANSVIYRLLEAMRVSTGCDLKAVQRPMADVLFSSARHLLDGLVGSMGQGYGIRTNAYFA